MIIYPFCCESPDGNCELPLCLAFQVDVLLHCAMQDLHDGLWLKELGFPPSGIQTWLGNLPSMGILIEKIIYKRIFSLSWITRG